MKVTAINDGAILNPCTLGDLNFQVDPYIGCEHYCYYCYVLPRARTDWTREVLVHENIKERLEEELSAIPPQKIYMGWHSDPYQPCERHSRQTRRVLELLLEKGFSASILTKSDLVLRDLDLLKDMPEASVSVSVSFAGDDVRRLFEHNTVETGRRIAALARLKSAGVYTSSLICPVIPYISDPLQLLKKLEPHTSKIWVYGLSIPDRSEVSWQNMEPILERHYPRMKREIESAVFSREHSYWLDLRQEVDALKEAMPVEIANHI